MGNTTNPRAVLFILAFMPYWGSLRANELPFGLTPEISITDAKLKVSSKAFLSFNERWSKDNILNYDATDFALNGVPVEDVVILFYKGRLLEVGIRTKDSDNINEAFSRLVKLQTFFSEQGKKISASRLHELKKGADLESKLPVVAIEGNPCRILIFTNLSKGSAYQLITYRVMAVQQQKIADDRKMRESENRKAVDMLR